MENLDVYDKLVAMDSRFDRLGKTMPYTSANGYMFSLLNKAGEIGIRLPKERAREFIEQHDSGPYKSHGAVIRDYVLIPPALLQDLELLACVLGESYDYVMTLKTPPRKNPPKKKAAPKAAPKKAKKSPAKKAPANQAAAKKK